MLTGCVGPNPYYRPPPEEGESETAGGITTGTTGPESTTVPTGSTDPTDPTTGPTTGMTSVGGVCGDGILDAGEECDDGADNGTALSPCSPLCTLDLEGCGDGILDDSEECDDGNTVDGDGCSAECTVEDPEGFCGDGIADGDEECDDGNDIDDDACLTDCTLASCGDGVLYGGVEECDDGNDIDDDTCTNECTSICGDGCIVVVSEDTGDAIIFEPEGYGIVEVYGDFVSPTSVAVGPGPKLYIGQPNALFSFDLKTEELSYVAALGGALPHGITIHEELLYISGNLVDKVRVLTLGGDYVDILSSLDGSNLRGNAFGPFGHFYLASLAEGPAQLWNPGLEYEGAFGGGYVEGGSAIATRPNGDVLLGGIDGSKYSVFEATGEYLKTATIPCDSKLRSFATDPLGRLYAACYGDQHVAVLGPDDKHIADFKVPFPSGVAILPKF